MSHVMLATPFFSSLDALQPNEQARVLQFVTKFDQNPAHPGISLERVRAAGEDLWSARVSQELRAILYKSGEKWALLHADHHDEAYAWAERKQVGPHSVTGAIGLVDVEEVERVQGALASGSDGQSDGIFARHDDDYLVSLGVPEAWLPAVREIRNEADLWTVCEALPDDVAERLLILSTGQLVTPPPAKPDAPEEAPDTKRRFWVAENTDELSLALESPLEKWIAFLHPSQRAIVDGEFNGPVKVSGSAGTGKTVVALHRARKLAREGHNVLLTSYVTTLCENLQRNLERIATPEVRGRIRISTVHALALEVVRGHDPSIRPAGSDTASEALDRAATGSKFEPSFVHAEWENVIQRQGIEDWPTYRGTLRVGRGSPLSVRDRQKLWAIFQDARERLSDQNRLTWADLCLEATRLLEDGLESPFDAVIVDELQDLNAPEIRFLWALAEHEPENFMLVGDAGQRIYPGGFSLRSLGIEVRGRSHVLRVNYRTTEQIREAADSLLGHESDDMDSGTERRDLTRSLLRGPEPIFRAHASWDEEKAAAAEQVAAWLEDGLEPKEIAIFARTRQHAAQVGGALRDAGIEAHELKRDSSFDDPGVRYGSMHRAKGLEFKAVIVVGVSDSLLPHPRSLERAEDPKDRDEVIEQERRLVYVAMTRARDELLVSWHGAPSRFLAPVLEE